MKVKVTLKKSHPEFYEHIIPMISDEFETQILQKKRIFILDQSEYSEIVAELSAYINHEEEFSPETMLDVEKALEDFTRRWVYVF